MTFAASEVKRDAETNAVPAAVALQAPALPAVPPLYQRLLARFIEVTAESLDAFLAAPGRTLLVFLDEPERIKESLDLAVIAPELAAAFPQFRVGVLLPQAANAVARRFGFRRWPALVATDGPAYVGAIDGLRDWSEYLERMQELQNAAPSRPPTVGIPVRSADGGDAAPCH